MPVLSFMFRRIQWYRLSGLFGHAGFKVGDFLPVCLSVFISLSLIFIHLPFSFCLPFYFFLCFSPVPLSLFIPLCLFVFSVCIIFFLPRCLNFPPFSVLSPVIVFFRCSLSHLPAFLFIRLSLSSFFICFFRFIFPVCVAHVFLPVLSGEREDHFDIILFRTSIILSIHTFSILISIFFAVILLKAVGCKSFESVAQLHEASIYECPRVDTLDIQMNISDALVLNTFYCAALLLLHCSAMSHMLMYKVVLNSVHRVRTP